MNDRRKVYEALQGASSFLKDKGREEAAARILLQHELGVTYSGLLASMREEISEGVFQRFWRNIELHGAGTPVQHLTGSEEFYGRTFQVNKDVLIPRPETEELVEEALQLIERHLSGRQLAIADIGTGSGVIAVTMKCELPAALVAATDISEAALATAKENAKQNGAEVIFQQGDLAAPLKGRKWNVILSNPPYIAYSEAPGLSDTVHDFEPHEALFAEKEGLALYEEMARQLPDIVDDQCIIGFEIGHTQGSAVAQLLKEAFPQAKVYVKKDINKNDRMVFALLNELPTN
ncbi:peptide chain release factor N(5)-glutamine methyltransferase [Planococcus salinus]|uniref:Release factor glutamine methyltransferase n=1 Tax=Planococcus salinus TaxID=1848460 RepID=A0A3M8P8J4_9BACL|nr:peptide chain release factor N(5)-glutamine methyltransferase [Planococcus salinus]RNF40026.1 peptide chain release factor N(5)-glutamine methyltransferase [Planococcus salinus]